MQKKLAYRRISSQHQLTTGIEKCYSILKRTQLNRIFAAFVTFVHKEFKRLRTGTSWHEQKTQHIRFGRAGNFA